MSLVEFRCRARAGALALGLLSAFSLGGCAFSEPNPEHSRLHVAGGTALNASDALAASVLALVRDNGVTRVAFGTAVVVGRRTLLTAAHVFLEEPHAERGDIALDGAAGPVYGVRIRPTDIAFHPAWASTLRAFSSPTGLHIPSHPPSPVGDLAVVTLADDLPPALVTATLDDGGTLQSTDVLHAVGHGWAREPNADGRGLPSTTPTTALYRVLGGPVSSGALETKSSPIDPRTGVCDGDSGGPLFKEVREDSGFARYVLVGILSRSGSPGCAGQVAIHTSVAATAAFWKPFVK